MGLPFGDSGGVAAISSCVKSISLVDIVKANLKYVHVVTQLYSVLVCYKTELKEYSCHRLPSHLANPALPILKDDALIKGFELT